MRKQAFLAIELLVAAMLASSAVAGSYAGDTTVVRAPRLAEAFSDDRRGAEQQIRKAIELVRKMNSDLKASRALSRAKGVFLVPVHGDAAASAGDSGGEGVLLVRQGDSWSNPLFYNMEAVSLGAQAGASISAIALVLMNDKAVQSFRQRNKFSLGASARLTIEHVSAGSEKPRRRSDIVLWTDAEGDRAGAAIAVFDISFDEAESRAYYDAAVAPNSPGGLASAPEGAKRLKRELALAR